MKQIKSQINKIAFGGDTFNYSWLIQSAEAQNTFKDPDAITIDQQQTELEAFADGLNRQLLSQISRALLSSQISLDGGLQPGTFSFGDLEIEILEGVDGLIVNILDITTGDTTQVTVPNN